MKISSEEELITFKLLLWQLYGAYKILIGLSVLFAIFLISFLVFKTDIIYYPLYFLFWLFFIILSASLITSIHERAHLLKAKKLGYKTHFVILRVGNIWVEIDNEERLTLYEHYLVSRAPWYDPWQFISEIVIFVVWLSIAFFSPTGLREFLILLLILPVIMILSDLAGIYVIFTKKTKGIALNFVSKFTSGSDFKTIVQYNLNQGKKLN